METPFLSLIIPAYNEADRLPETLRRCIVFLQGWGHAWEIIVVDDGSTDQTARIVEDVAIAEPRVRLLKTPHSGKGAAVRAGMLAASGRWRFFADADLSMEIADLPRFFEQPVDVAVGSREAAGARRIGEPAGRHLLGRLFNACVRLVAVRDIQDTQCGYKLFSEGAARALFGRARLNGFAFDVELLYLAQRDGMSIREVPITWRHRTGSRVRVLTGFVAFLQILKIRWNDLLGRYARQVHNTPSSS